MNNTVSIVTAFKDIGRGDWRGTKNNSPIHSYIQRDTKTYLERFKRLTTLQNEIVCFTEEKFFDQILSYREDIKLIDIDKILKKFKGVEDSITKAQENDHFIKFVNTPSLPEYWSAKYVLINFLKSYFAYTAIQSKQITSENTAWIDFGYCRPDTYCKAGSMFKFNTYGKINMFAIDDVNNTLPVFEIVKRNKVYIQGCHIVAPNILWKPLFLAMSNALNTLLNCGLIDDDQTLLLMASRALRENVLINRIKDPDDWFVLFRDYSNG